MAADRAPALRASGPRSELTRWGDDLVMTVGGTRRSVRLDPLLRRCEVTGGSSSIRVPPGPLVVTFRPDPNPGRPTCWPPRLYPEGRPMNAGADWVEQGRKLVDTFMHPLTAGDAPGGPDRGHGSACRWCPVCQAPAVGPVSVRTCRPRWPTS